MADFQYRQLTPAHLPAIEISKNLQESEANSSERYEPQVGEWVLVEYDCSLFPGQVTDIHADSKEVLVNCMIPAKAPGHYRWPEFGRDEIWYREVRHKLQPPIPTTNRGDVFKFEFK